MKRLTFTDAAEQDFEAIVDYIAQSNPRRAATFVRQLQQSCEGLVAMPHRSPSLPRHQASGIRRRVHGNYLIFYRVTDNTVEVLHILHGVMDYEGMLFPEPPSP